MEAGFGTDLSDVRIHTDSNAVNMTQQLGAQAFTNQNNIYFNEGRYNPATRAGQHLLAHELTHTVQQGAVQVNETNEQQNNTWSTQTKGQNALQHPPTSISENQEISNETPQTEIPGNENGIEPNQQINEEPAAQESSARQEEQLEMEDNYPRSPQEDPNFQAAQNRVEQEATTQQTTRPARQESQAAQNAALSPANERQSQAQSAQVENMAQQEPNEFNALAFKQKLMERINNMRLPQNQEEATNFEDNNNIDEISQASQSDVSQEQEIAAGPIEQSTAQEPNTQAISEREIKPLPEPDVCRIPAPVNSGNALPQTRPQSQVNQPLQENTQEISRTMADSEITEEQLKKSNEPTFVSALEAKHSAQENAQNAPQQFRTQEKQTLNSGKQQAEIQSQAQLDGMHADRVSIANQVNQQQVQTGTQDTAERQRIANELNLIYEATKTEVNTILTQLDESVAQKFSTAATKAKKVFESYVKEKVDAYKSRRYSGLRGKARWLRDKFMGVPDEVNRYFSEGRQKYIETMDVALTDIANLVAEKLNEAKERIAKGKQDVSEYVAALPQNLQNIGQEAAESIQNRFDELENNVDAKQDQLIDNLAQKYNESLQAIDARIEEMKAANRGLVDKALDAVKGVIDTIVKIKNTLTNLLSSALSVIKTIIADPIGFLRNLISGVAQGFKNFGKNILKHLTSGLFGWLTGSLGSMGITIPNDLFSLKGIFSLVMQVLGLTWDYIRMKAVKLLGEPIVKALETGFEIFKIIKKDGISGLWKYIQQQFNDLKETVIGAIKEMIITKVIEAGIKWVIGLMSPAGAFVKAAMMIIDIVKFFIERGSQIIQLVQAFIEGVKAVASGSVAKVSQAIENALSKALPVVIGFLASLLGIGGLASKVQALIKKIRKRIDRAIDKVILKAKSWFKKAGTKIKGAAAKFFKFWKNKKTFKGTDNKNHKLYFRGEGKNAVLTVASTPTPLTTFITNASTGEDAQKKSAQTRALQLSQEIDQLKATNITGSNESEKSKKSKEINDSIKTKMDELVPLVNKLLGGEEKSVELLKQYLNKKVTNKDGSVNKKFIDAFSTNKNMVNGKMVYVFSDGLIRRGANMAEAGYMKIFISNKEGEEGFLMPGGEKKYIPPHTLFNPEDLKITKSNGIFVATYETKQTSGEGKQKYTVEIKFDQIEKGIPDKVENRTVKGEQMRKKPAGMGRGRTDSAGGGFDNAHLVGDRFGGSGYNQALNIYPSSENYNRVTMLNKEDALFNGLSSNIEFTMEVSAKINHVAGKRAGGADSHLKALLDKEFKKDTGGEKADEQVQIGMNKELRKEIAQDIKGVPGKFEKVDYKASQNGKTLNYNIGADSKYEDAVNQKLGA